MFETINAFLANYNPQLVLGSAALVGAMINSAYTVWKKKKEEPDFKFDITKIIDTAWQTVVAGVAVGSAIGGNVTGVVLAILTGIGVDTIANKVKIINAIELISLFVSGKLTAQKK